MKRAYRGVWQRTIQVPQGASTPSRWGSNILSGASSFRAIHQATHSSSAQKTSDAVPFETFNVIDEVPIGSHEVWYAEHRPTRERYYLKCPTVFRADIIMAQEHRQTIEDVFEGVSPAQAEFTVRKEMCATMLADLLFNRKVTSPEGVMCVKTGDFRHYLIASKEVKNYKSLEEFGNNKGEKFFVGGKGETRLWHNDHDHVATKGRIAAKFTQIALCWTDKNEENFGFIPHQEGYYQAAVIDFGECLERCQYAQLSRQEYAKLLMRGKAEPPIPAMDLRGLNITRRKEVRDEVIRHIACCAMEGKEIRRVFNETFGNNFPNEYKRKIAEVGKILHHSLTGFVLAGQLTGKGWDGSDNMAEEIWAIPENRKEYVDFLQQVKVKKEAAVAV